MTGYVANLESEYDAAWTNYILRGRHEDHQTMVAAYDRWQTAKSADKPHIVPR